MLIAPVADVVKVDYPRACVDHISGIIQIFRSPRPAKPAKFLDNDVFGGRQDCGRVEERLCLAARESSLAVWIVTQQE